VAYIPDVLRYMNWKRKSQLKTIYFHLFVENRSILDNVLVVSEILHHMKCKSKGEKRGK